MLFLLLIILFNSLQSTELIVRDDFFNSYQRHSFKIDDIGENLYFLEQGNNNLYKLNILSKNIDTIQLQNRILTYYLINNKPLFLIQNNKNELVYNDKTLDFGDYTRLRLIIDKPNAYNEIAVELQFNDSLKNGIYSFNFNTLHYEKIYSTQDMSRVYLDENLNLIAGEKANRNGSFDYFYYKNTKWNQFLSLDWEMDNLLGGFSKILSVTNDGKYIYYTSNKNSDKSKLFRFDIKNEKSELVKENDLVDLLPFAYSIDSKGHITSVVGLFAKTIRECLDTETESDFKILDKMFDGDIGFAQSIDNDRKWLIREISGGPNKYYLFNRNTKDIEYICSDYPNLDNKNLAKRFAYSVKTNDNFEVPFHVYLPDGSDKNEDGIPDSPLPTIMYVHGGPWVGVAHWNQYFHWRNFQLLANRGYAVINTEFRGATGLGKEFVNTSKEQWNGVMQQDLKDIKNWCIENKISKSDKIGIWGWSYGAYATLAALSFSPDEFACGIAMYGPTDMYAANEEPFTNNEFWRNWVGRDSAFLKEISPYHNANKIKSPVLLTTGSKDERVQQSQIEKMATKLDSLGQNPIYFYYPEEGHDYREDASWISFWAIGEHFLKENLGGKAQLIKEDFDKGNKIVLYGQEKIDNYLETN